MSQLPTLDEPKFNTLNAKRKDVFENYTKTVPKNSESLNNIRHTINQSWDFTPFPQFLFPHEKKRFLKSINKLNFPGVKDRFNYTKSFRNKKFKIFVEEIKGDITKNRAPAYTFGSPRNEVKLHFQDFPEPISPSPGSYNLRPLSLKFFIIGIIISCKSLIISTDNNFFSSNLTKKVLSMNKYDITNLSLF